MTNTLHSIGKRRLALVPSSLLCLPVALAAQTTPSEQLPAGSTTPVLTSTNAVTTLDENPVNTQITTTPSFYGAAGQNTTPSIGVPGFATQAPPPAPETAADYPLRWGPFTAHPHLTYGFTYADNVLIHPGETSASAFHSLSPGLTIESKHLALDYTPSLLYYTEGPYEDVVNHSASLRGHFGYGDWIFGIQQSYVHASQPLVQTGGLQTQSETFNTLLTASWNLNPKVFFDFSISQEFQDNTGYQGFSQWSTMDWVNYRVTEHFSAGVGVGGGYANVDLGSDMTYEQYQARLNWTPSTKLMLVLNGGAEVRQFLDTPGSENMINPLMGANLSYHLFEPTTLTLSANRNVTTSLYANQVTENFNVSGGVSQRLLKYLHLGVSAGYQKMDYKFTAFAINGTFLTTRKDDYTFVTTSLSTSFLRKGTASVSYVHSENDSSAAGYTYGSDQVTVQVGYRF